MVLFDKCQFTVPCVFFARSSNIKRYKKKSVQSRKASLSFGFDIFQFCVMKVRVGKLILLTSTTILDRCPGIFTRSTARPWKVFARREKKWDETFISCSYSLVGRSFSRGVLTNRQINFLPSSRRTKYIQSCRVHTHTRTPASPGGILPSVNACRI